ncbi:hypothetical protein EDB19DRAFT_1730939 [Suillus lakei]|nr:hypothetical protein EDB19DRAFT_1730939 [Suillus lakei]
MLPYASPNMRQRAEHVLQNTEAIGCHGYLTPSSLVFGNPCLNLASAANLFNTWLGLEFLDEQEANDFCAVEDFDAEGQRKQYSTYSKTYAMDSLFSKHLTRSRLDL